MAETRETIARLLQTLSGRKEIDAYLRRYTGVEAQRFAVIRVDGGLLTRERQAVASALAFLHRLGLLPIVVHGAGRRLGEALLAAGAEETWLDGIPVVPPAAAEAMRRIYQAENLALVDALAAEGCPARPVPAGVFLAEPRDAARYGLVGAVREVDDTALRSAFAAGQLPIVTDLALSPAGQVLFVDDDDAVGALARRFLPYKVVYLHPDGGLLDSAGRVIPAINLAADGTVPLAITGLPEPTRRRLARLAAMLEGLPDETSISVTAPDDLVRELFTHQGRGTLVRRGEAIVVARDFDGVDRDRLRALISSCFGRALADDYFERKRCQRVYVTESYRAAAVITEEAGLAYLDKLAVTSEARGEGLAAKLWSRMRADFPQLYWRARDDNPVRGWYFDRADGGIRRGRWVVFWYGIDDFDDIRRCVEAACALPETLAPRTE
ncbi:MAG: acetylglutamate kinase [bacterium]